ncbi:MAG: ATP-binding protein [Albidovulum sp.]
MDTPSTTQAPEADTLAPHARLSLLGHDMRSAVSDILGGLRLIDPETMDEPARRQLERVRSSGESLALLLEEGLAMMLGHEALATAHPSNLLMRQFLCDLDMRWSGRAQEKGLELNVALGGSVPEVLSLDRVALERVLSNILSNAIKFTDHGRVSLDITTAPNGALRFSVSDQGPGFSVEALTRLFEYKGRPSGNLQPGQGLGLHITKNMAGRLGGMISVENLPEKGSRVTLDLPADTWRIADAQKSTKLPDLSNVKVLIADDNQTYQTTMALMLAKMGATSEIAADGIETLRWLEREKFDLALIDIEMPHLNGLDVIRTLSHDRSMANRMPIIAITAYTLRAHHDAIINSGADMVLTKPFAAVEQFGAVIASVLARNTPALPIPPLGATALPEVKRDSFDHMIALAGPASASEFIDRLCKDLQNTRRDLIAGLADGDATLIRSQTHILVALAGAVGAERLQNLAQDMNTAANQGCLPTQETPDSEIIALLDQLILFVEQERRERGEAE